VRCSHELCKSPINPIINPIPVYSHSITWQYIYIYVCVCVCVCVSLCVCVLFKVRSQKQSRSRVKKLNQKLSPSPHGIKSPNLYRDTGVRSSLVARLLLLTDTPELCTWQHEVDLHLSITCVRSPTLLHIEVVCCSSKDFSIAYLDNEVSSKTIHRLVTNFWDTESGYNEHDRWYVPHLWGNTTPITSGNSEMTVRANGGLWTTF
jgi:hypothetical protein